MRSNISIVWIQVWLLLAGTAALLPTMSEAAPVSKTVSTQMSCAALALNNEVVTQSDIETAAGEGRQECVIHGQIVSSPDSIIHFRVDLPEPGHWNSNLMMIGGGGFDGIVPTDSANGAGFWFAKILGADAGRLGSYALVSSDSGHQGRGADPTEDFSWVAHNPMALRNHAYQANHLALWAAVDLAQQFYGKSPTHRYIIGGSNGGRAGLVAIQHYPTDYDGVLSFEPAISQEGFTANLGPQMLQHIFASPENWLGPAQIALYEKSELRACDALDGLKDGILGNVAACHYDARDLQCRDGQIASETCLTSGQIESIRRIHTDKDVPVTLADGWSGYTGYGRGSTSDWASYLFGPTFASRAVFNFVAADQIVKWGITNDPNASVVTLDPIRWEKQFRALSDEIDATDPQLDPFYEHGGKLIVWYGVSDACVSYRQTARYVDSVKAKLGAAKLPQFMRFYVSPGTGHSMSGAGESTEPLLSTMETWVEKGQAPGTMISTLTSNSASPGATRPLCEYPLYPRYVGKGDPNIAASFVCASQ